MLNITYEMTERYLTVFRIPTEEQSEWEILSINDKNYVGDILYGRPKFVIAHKTSPRVMVVHQANRFDDDDGPSPFEQYAAILMALTVKTELDKTRQRPVDVEAKVVFKRFSEMYDITWDQADLDHIAHTTSEVCSTNVPQNVAVVAKILAFSHQDLRDRPYLFEGDAGRRLLRQMPRALSVVQG